MASYLDAADWCAPVNVGSSDAPFYVLFLAVTGNGEPVQVFMRNQFQKKIGWWTVGMENIIPFILPGCCHMCCDDVDIHSNLSYPGTLGPSPARILDMPVTENS